MRKKESYLSLYSWSEWKERWRLALHSRSFILQSVSTLLAGLVVVLIIPPFLLFIQSIPGHYINDPLLKELPAYDVSLYIFICLYALLLVAVVQLSFHPVLSLKALQAYLLLTVMRGCSIYLFPLEPPVAIIPLVDPVIEHFFYEKVVITKDLFFSGHTSMLSLLCLVIPFGWTKRVALLITLLVAALLLVQHVHYTIDVLAAPLAAWLAWKVAESIKV